MLLQELYVLMRLHQVLCERLGKAVPLAEEARALKAKQVTEAWMDLQHQWGTVLPSLNGHTRASADQNIDGVLLGCAPYYRGFFFVEKLSDSFLVAGHPWGQLVYLVWSLRNKDIQVSQSQMIKGNMADNQDRARFSRPIRGALRLS